MMIDISAVAAIPVFLSQRQKAHDSSTTADVSNPGDEIASYHVDGPGPVAPDLATAPGQVFIRDPNGYQVLACDDGVSTGLQTGTCS